MSLPDTVATHRFSSKLDSIDETDPCRSMASELIQKEEENPNIMVYKKVFYFQYFPVKTTIFFY